MITAIKIIFLLGFLIIIHETGHFIIARICKIKVNEFSIGFGPKIFSKTKNQTTYEVRLIPLGGFVSLEGENGSSDITEDLDNKIKSNADTKDEISTAFYKASYPKQMAVILAGAIVNIIFGILTCFILIAIRHYIITDNDFISSIQYSINSTIELIKSMGEGIIQIFTGHITLNDMAGPVGISAMVYKTSGIIEFVYLLAIVSISLGITNLLPIIPLDGGKAILILIEALRKKPLKRKTEATIQSIGFIALITFSFIVTFNDITKLIVK